MEADERKMHLVVAEDMMDLRKQLVGKVKFLLLVLHLVLRD